MTRKAGRPNESTQARAKLIFHARELYMTMPYDKVSTRLVAERAGVNIAMIRYYFGNKQGLFETMIRETMQPISQQMKMFVERANQESLVDLMRAYYQTMINTPEFPRLIVQIMNMSESDMQRKLLEKIFREVTKPAQKMMFEKLLESGVLRENLDPKLCRMTFMSMMVFPFIAPRAMLSIHGIEINKAFLEQLLEHNINIITHGFISPEYLHVLGENNEN
ncbi:TetR/AcrR family transcriptional regulator [Vibrio sp. TH_r3]|uniref:TetR/AcrR family transcriptional regulator n=1 Tax=Vibrio sp. TH_r3 TaxID=3082084 RepID=UPI002955AFCA|nr:TetR/AcrR family transcriptional regulator [Vibrio sp. TH_r3]MDV7105817.1 TetR/AcrR family transcriptional regulator [Vibrio sp. TH_r3]